VQRGLICPGKRQISAPEGAAPSPTTIPHQYLSDQLFRVAEIAISLVTGSVVRSASPSLRPGRGQRLARSRFGVEVGAINGMAWNLPILREDSLADDTAIVSYTQIREHWKPTEFTKQ
jgi:hypothetical protein